MSVAVGLLGAMVGGATAGTSPSSAGPEFSLAAAASGDFKYVPLTPNRIVDSRYNIGITGSLKTGVAKTFTVINRYPGNAATNVPTGAVGVTGNLTVDKPTARGYLSLTPVATNAPGTSTVNFPAGDTRANAVTSALGAGGKLSVTYIGYKAGSTAHAVFDVTGYFVATTVSGGGVAGPTGPAGVTGPAGATGPVGPVGPAGATGPAGAVGPAGADGADGDDGAVGPAGPAGADGADGADGAAGPAGPAGADGATGPAGADGATGPAGADGATGPAGADGAAGADGPAGPAGADGATGPAGADGATGPAGPAGPAGADGAPGPAGPAGADGGTGPAGADGATGPAGPAGPQGPAGPVGADGFTSYRAGTVTLRSAGTPTGETTVTFSSAVSSANYRVTWMITSDTDWGNNSGFGYLYATSKTVNGFTIVLNDFDGDPKNAPASVTVDWMVLPSN